MRFYFDVISPYAYLANERVHALAEAHGREVTWVPILFAALLDAYGHKGPAEIPPKRVYTLKQVTRYAHAQGVPLVPPPAHPFNPLLALRLATLDIPRDDLLRLVDLLFRRTWAEGLGVTDLEAVSEAIDGIGLAGKDLVTRAQDPENKAALKRNTADAVARGVFGVPSFEVDGEVFWGQDSIPHVHAFLRGEDPVDDTLLDRWRDLPTGAQRPGAAKPRE